MLLEKTQRRLCRLLFVAGCVLPTLAVASFTSSRFGPAFADGLLDQVGQHWGVALECDSLVTPRPGVYELHDVRMTDAASDRDFAAIDLLRVTDGEDGFRFEARGAALRRPAEAWVLRLLQSDLAVYGKVEGLSIDDTRLDKASVSLTTTAGTRRLRVASSDGARLETQLAGGVCTFEADTATVSVASDWLPAPALRAIGAKRARFRGKASGRAPLDGAPASGVASGRIEASELKVSGVEAKRGVVELTDFAWRGERIERFVGRLDLREGKLSRPVVYGMCRWLTMEPFAKLETRYSDPANHAWFDFTQLACDVELDEQGLVLVAGCGVVDGKPRGGAVAHAVVELDGDALLREPTHRPLPTQRLVQAWFPDDPAELPATSAAIEMASRLPGASVR